MTTRENVFDVLSRSEGEAVSGEKLAEICGVSRAAIWKAVKSLREEGFIIEGTTNGGYVYNGESDVLSAEAVKTFLASAFPNLSSASVECFKTIDSTLSYAKRLLADGDKLKLDNRIIVAATQTQGRGRLGRTFCSPEKTGIYLTVI
ncbi:MAG: HTH domain-containing protein, partial [Spirochaetaceae bacterium]|nr:HTH domain-containing protein [Spirochaetaceae bacterium]